MPTIIESFIREFLLNTLTERELRIVLRRPGDLFGMGLKNETYKAIGIDENVGPQRILDINRRAHRKIYRQIGRLKSASTQPQVIIKYIDPPKELPENHQSLIVYKPIEALGEMSVRAANCLKTEGIDTVQQLIEKMPSELLRKPNFGRKSLQEINQILANHGLQLGTKL